MMHSENEQIQYSRVLALPLNLFGSSVCKLDKHSIIKYCTPLRSSSHCVGLVQAVLTLYEFVHLPAFLALFPCDPYKKSIKNSAHSDENLG